MSNKKMKIPKKKLGLEAKQNLTGWVFIGISLIAVIIFSFYPMIQSFITSLQSGMGTNLKFVGLDNYKRLMNDPKFWQGLKNNIIYLAAQVPIMLILAMFIAVLLNNPKLKFRGFFRTAIFLPCVTSSVAYAIIFKSMFNVNGIINKFLISTNILDPGSPIKWLMDSFWGKITIIIAITWRWTGYNMIFFLSGLQNIDASVFEAADIDGATAFQKFRKITLPLLKPIVLVTAIMSTNGTIQLFDEVVNLTGGGPGISTSTISQYIYNLSFKWTPDFGYASAISYVVVFIVAALSLLQAQLGGNKDDKKI